MKKLLFSFIALSLACIGCQKAEDVKSVGGEEVLVSLNLTGDYNVDVSQSPLTKASASTNDAYAINVYYD